VVSREHMMHKTDYLYFAIFMKYQGHLHFDISTPTKDVNQININPVPF
jgi:hypothetical protein